VLDKMDVVRLRPVVKRPHAAAEAEAAVHALRAAAAETLSEVLI